MTTKPKRQKSALAVPQPDPDGFAEIAALIATSQQDAYRAVNTALIDLYWQVGEYVSRKIEAAEWGSGTVENLARSSPIRIQGCAASPDPTYSE